MHGSKDIVYFENEFRDHVIMQRFGAGHRTLVSDTAEDVLTTDTWYTGPGILLSKMEGQHPSVIMICNGAPCWIGNEEGPSSKGR